MNGEIKYYKSKAAAFVLSTVYAALSLQKMAEGMSGKSLLSSYDFVTAGDIAYSAGIAFAAAVLALAVVKILEKYNKQKWIECFDAVLFILLLAVGIAAGKTYNKLYFLIYALSVISAAVHMILPIKFKENAEYLTWRDWKKACLPLCFWFLPVGVCIPVELYIKNPKEFKFEFGYYFIVLFVCTIGFILGASVCSVLFLNKRQHLVMSLTLCSMSFMGYLQEMLMNGRLKVLDGDAQEWRISTQEINAAVWIICIVGIFLLQFKKPKAIKIYMAACLYLTLVQLCSTGYLIAARNPDRDSLYKAFTNKGSLEIDRGNNVIVILMDRFDAEFIEQIMQEDKEFIEPLNDFTFYPNATGQFGRTRIAVPYLLTGVEWKEDTGADCPKT